jgi:hypothetical protein
VTGGAGVHTRSTHRSLDVQSASELHDPPQFPVAVLHTSGGMQSVSWVHWTHAPRTQTGNAPPHCVESVHG